MIIYSKEESLIKPQGIKNLEGTRDKKIKLPYLAFELAYEIKNIKI